MLDQAAGGVQHSSGSGSAATGGDDLRLVAFSLGGEWYALEVPFVRGIETAGEITRVPMAPQWLVGVFNLRGTIVPVVDCRPLLGLRAAESGCEGLLLVFQQNGNTAALQVDSVDEMYDVARSSLERPPLGSEGALGGLILGRVRVRDRVISVVDVQALVEQMIGE